MFVASPFFDNSRLAHGFFTRRGGVSEGVFNALNCGLSNADLPANVKENRARAMKALDLAPESLTSLYQIHGSDVVTLTAPIAPEIRPEADAMVTRTPGVTLGILSADCAPLLFADVKAGVIGAAHSGWKGTQANIAAATIAAMRELGASDITAVIGPCIAQESYEVDAKFRTTFLEQNETWSAFFMEGKRDGHYQFNLPGLILRQLEVAGVKGYQMDHDTCREESLFFSNRRTAHRGEQGFGLQLSAIALRG